MEILCPKAHCVLYVEIVSPGSLLSFFIEEFEKCVSNFLVNE
jgi:hypothetical protein